jgi:DNA-binding IclR family transcriptional regulator
MPKPSPSVVQSLDRGLILLETVAKSRHPLGLAELAPVLGIDRSSVFRLANTLKHRGFLAQLPDTKGYVLGSAVWRLASLHPWSEVLAQFAREQVAKLADWTKETTHLAVREGSQAALIDHQLTGQPVGVSTGSGSCVPLHCTSVGKALIADCDHKQLVAIFGKKPLEVLTKRTIHSLDALARDCLRTRERGYALDDEENAAGVRCISVPIRDADGKIIASIGVSAPVQRLPKNRCDVVARHVRQAAEAISAKLGCNVSKHL